MSHVYTHETFVSPFTWRYGSDEMRALWSEQHRRRLWRRVWVALAQTQAEAGVIRDEQAHDLLAHAEDIDLARALAIEAEIHHDLMAEVQAYAEQCPIGGGIIHLGATSADVEDNADVLRIREAMHVLLGRVRAVLAAFAETIERLADEPTMAFTHIQPAEPTTMGYRMAMYAQDLLADWHALKLLAAALRGKGMRGAVGTGASYSELLAGTEMTAAQLSEQVMARLDLRAFDIVTQTYPRKQDWQVLSALAGLAATVHKFALDLRLLQSPMSGEWGEPFAARQVGSSAMPFKRNPVTAEKLDSLARLIAAQAAVAWDNAAQSILERSLDDSANRREILPVAFLAADEMLLHLHRLVRNLRIDHAASERLLAHDAVFAATERVLMAAARAGGDRQMLHERLREASMRAWDAVRAGSANPLPDLLCADPDLTRLLAPETIRALLDARTHLGDAPQRAHAFAQLIHRTLHQEDETDHAARAAQRL